MTTIDTTLLACLYIFAGIGALVLLEIIVFAVWALINAIYERASERKRQKEIAKGEKCPDEIEGGSEL